MVDPPLRFPRLIEDDPRAESLRRLLAGGSTPLVAAGPALRASLRSAAMARRLVRGLDDAQSRLDAELKGLDMADRASGSSRGVRISRLMIVASDVGDAFLRRLERLRGRQGGRVIVVRVDATTASLGEMLFGAGRRAGLVMLAHKEAVASALLAIADDWAG